MGGAPKASGAVRPKSAYGHGSHARSKSYQQGPRPATAMLNRDDDDDGVLEIVDQFMKRVGELYEVVVFTASVSKVSLV